MKDVTKRSILRWIHIVFAIPILGYIYSPFQKLPDHAPATRFIFLPVMVLTGLWMWKAMSFDDLFRSHRPNQKLQRIAGISHENGQEFEAEKSNESIATY